MNSPPKPISLIGPLAPAFERAKTILFKPFDFEKWAVIGFCAWLAFLGQGGGGGVGGGHLNIGRRGRELRHGFEQAKDWVINNLHWLVPLAAFLLIVGLSLWLVFTWLSSRGRFMFLHCVVRNKAEVRIPWNTYAARGDSLFLFRIILGLVAFGIIAPLLAACAWRIATIFSKPESELLAISSTVALGILAVIVALFFTAIRKLTLDFVVPIMSLGTPSCWAAWREFIGLFTARPAQFVLYLLFQIVLHLAIGISVVIIVLLTCCIAGCLLSIPYLGTVLLLPILVFERSYSLSYLAQFDPKYDVFAPIAPPQYTTAVE
jgi:hypothetical protein